MSTPSTWMPRAATSVHTSASRRPFLNRSRTFERSCCDMPPCRPSALTPASRSSSAMRSTASWVRTKTMVRPGRPATAAVMVALSRGPMSSRWWVMVVTAPADGSTECSTGSDRYFLTRTSISSSSVAENSMRWPSGSWSNSSSTSGRKPMSAIWSASSRTATSTESREHSPRRMRSRRRPGVATSMSTPARSASIWRENAVPPHTTFISMPTASPKVWSESATWIASSRVGVRMIALGCFGLVRPPAARRARAGRPKARVLPEPVWARPRTSRPASASGMVAAWMGKGTAMPFSASAAVIFSGSPRSSNAVWVSSGFTTSVSTVNSSAWAAGASVVFSGVSFVVSGCSTAASDGVGSMVMVRLPRGHVRCTFRGCFDSP